MGAHFEGKRDFPGESHKRDTEENSSDRSSLYKRVLGGKTANALPGTFGAPWGRFGLRSDLSPYPCTQARSEGWD